MPSQTNENALETLIYNHLTDRTGYQPGNPSDYDPNFAIDTAKLWQFLQTSQPDQLKKLQDTPNWQQMILERIDRKLKKDGILAVLKKGIAIHDAEFILYYSQPYNDLNPDLQTRFEQNIFSVSRQIHFSPTETTHSIDLVIFLNGLPISTIELKNTWTGQTTYHARKQYCERNPKDPLFNFARCLVHFAADTDEIWMATRLSGKSTYFLPFNKGHNHGQGNPTNPSGHKTSYQTQVIDNPNQQNSRLAIAQLIRQAINEERRRELSLYKNYSQDRDFQTAFETSIIRILEAAIDNPALDLLAG